MSDRQEKIREIITRVWKDESYKQKLLSDPKKALSEAGIAFPTNYKLKVHIDSADTINIVIPRNPAESELSDEALNSVSGGTGDTCLNTTCQDHCW